MDVRLTFTQASRSQTVDVMTIDNDIFEANQRICLRLTNLIEPCPGSVILGDDTEIEIAEDESKLAIIYVFINIKLYFLFSYSSSVYITMLY